MGSGHHHHDHSGANHHGHASQTYDRAFAFGIALNLGFVLVEAAVGLSIGSLALVADAGHNLSDVLGLGVAWAAILASRKPPSKRFTYGLRHSSILASLFNAILLLVACGAIALEAIRRFAEPAPIAGQMVIAVAAVGIVINGITALLLRRGAKSDLNMRGAYLHMAADAGISAGVVVAGALMLWTGATWLDPVVSLAIVTVIVVGTWRLLTEATSMALAAKPSHIDSAAVEAYLLSQPGVSALHDLHIWPIGTSDVALTVHLVMPCGAGSDQWLQAVAEDLAHQFGIAHPTIQIERGDALPCPQEPASAL